MCFKYPPPLKKKVSFRYFPTEAASKMWRNKDKHAETKMQDKGSFHFLIKIRISLILYNKLNSAKQYVVQGKEEKLN